jgi:hypothetical protein
MAPNDVSAHPMPSNGFRAPMRGRPAVGGTAIATRPAARMLVRTYLSQVRYEPQALFGGWLPIYLYGALTSGQNKHFSHTEHTVGLARRCELEFQLPLDHQDQVNLIGGEPVLIHRLAELAHPNQLDALPGEHGPNVPERRGPDLAGLPTQDIEHLQRGSVVTVSHHRT